MSLIDRVEKPCPQGWWGSPMCGPCNCDTARGFHKDCNKTTGECRCKVKIIHKMTLTGNTTRFLFVIQEKKITIVFCTNF